MRFEPQFLTINLAFLMKWKLIVPFFHLVQTYQCGDLVEIACNGDSQNANFVNKRSMQPILGPEYG